MSQQTRFVISNLYIYNQIMQLQQASTIQPKKGHQSDKYQGALHPITKKRHGPGSYSYDNPFFTFNGNYQNGQKNGPGTLKFRDGRIIHAQFQDDQMVGQAEILYPDGGRYVGTLQLGEKEGEGIFESTVETYSGQWRANCRHGKGLYRNLSTGETYEGDFLVNKPHGVGHLARWNYSYRGTFEAGFKQGEGIEVSDWLRDQSRAIGRYEYSGNFKCDRFDGKGVFKSRETAYTYTGEFTAGKPNVYPNEFRCLLSTNSRSGDQIIEGEKSVLNQPIDYQLEGDSFNLYIDCVYQGPEVLDQVQPTQEQIDAMVKAWQVENKKNKNPPPMPDFTQPRMKKPEMVLVEQQNGRPIEVRLLRETQGKEESMKVDYRLAIIAKRKDNQELRQEALRKAEEEGNKKGGKKDSKGEPQLKVNLFNAHPHQKDKVLKLETTHGRCSIMKVEFPDDFPVGKYWLQVSSCFRDFGDVKAVRKELNVRAKLVKKK